MTNEYGIKIEISSTDRTVFEKRLHQLCQQIIKSPPTKELNEFSSTAWGWGQNPPNMSVSINVFSPPPSPLSDDEIIKVRELLK